MTILWFILLWPINTQHGGRAELGWWGNDADLLDINSEAFGTASSSVEEKKVQKRTCDIFVHLRHFCWDLDSVCTENVLQWKKKNYTYGTQNWGGPTKNCFILFFSVLIVIVHACLSREGDMFVILLEKKQLLLFNKKKGPMIQTLSV